MSSKLPVFFHVPKCAGTYVCSILSLILTRFVLGVDNIKYIIVTRGDHTLYRLVCTTANPLNNKYIKQDRWTYFVNYDDLDIDDLNLFFVEVCASSFSNYKDFIYSKLPVDVTPYEFIILREPYSLTKSFYNYLSSDKSIHEPTNTVFNFSKFEDYLNSSKLQGSWLIRNFLNISNEIAVTKEHFNMTCGILDSMLVNDMSDVDYTILTVIEDCFNIVDKDIINKIPEIRKTRNIGIHVQDIKFDDLEEKTKSHFLTQTRWDLKLYNKYKK